jgi:PTS system glucose-specific IIC component
MNKLKRTKNNDLKTSDENIKLENHKSKAMSKVMAVLQKFGRGLMLPISILPFAGILLGIGGAISTNVTTEVGQTVGGIFQGMSNVIFANLPILFCIAIVITFTGESGGGAFMAVISYLVFTASQTIFIHQPDGEFHDVMWFYNQAGVKNLVSQNLGITSLSTGLFGAIIVAVIVVVVYNKFKYIQLPQAISFFSGIRFLPFILIPASFGLAVVFTVFWPWIGLGISWFGEKISQAPTGVDGLVYGIAGRALMPFGLHTILITIAYQSEFGGSLNLNTLENLQLDPTTKQTLIDAFNNFTNGSSSITGDQNIWNYINSIPLNTIEGEPIFAWFKSTLGINAGRFMQDYPIYQGACVGIGLALILTASKENRKAAISVIGSAIIVAFLTGITEPLEYTFLFVAPLLYYVIYVPLSGIAYLLMELVNAHVGVGFARGFIDLMVYGALPVKKGTNFYWSFLFDIILGSITFVTFYFWIKGRNLATPGRNGNDIVLVTKKAYQNKNKTSDDTTKPQKADERMMAVADNIGGFSNVVSVTACATRLRLVVKDPTVVDKEALKQLGAAGTVIKGDNVQVIFGGEAVVLAEKMNDYIKLQVTN